ncbi:MAG: ABC transporter permease [Nitrospiria bacterium]
MRQPIRAHTRRVSVFIRQTGLSGWGLIPFFIAVLVLIPIGVVLSSFFSPSDDVWRHLVDTLLARLLLNTLWLTLGVVAGTALLGVSLAWLTAACDFPFRKIFDWALMLPMAIPSYVTAFVAIGLLDFTGPVQTGLRHWFGRDDIWFPRIRSTGGVILVMTLALYPYVYLLARNAFLTQGRRGMEAAQSLGHGRWGGFFRVALPMGRPWIVGGIMLVLMETLADFGTVSIFNYDTFATAVYKAWFGFFSLSAASQLASLLVLIVFVLLLVEQRFRARMRYTQVEKGGARGERIMLGRPFQWLAFAYVLVVLIAAFLIPVSQLSVWTYQVFESDFDSRYMAYLSHSLFLGGMGALFTVAAALLLAYADRLRRTFPIRIMVRIATLGYALPGSVLAVGIFIPLAWLDNRMISLGRSLFGLEFGLILNGTLVALFLAYLIRFLAVAHHPIQSAIQRITPTIDETARSLGLSGISMLRRVHLPVLKGGLLTAAILVFVDVMKEMPITLMTRPFGWDTLAVRIFEMTSEGEWERAALPAVVLVVTGFLPIVLLTKQSR